MNCNIHEVKEAENRGKEICEKYHGRSSLLQCETVTLSVSGESVTIMLQGWVSGYYGFQGCTVFTYEDSAVLRKPQGSKPCLPHKNQHTQIVFQTTAKQETLQTRLSLCKLWRPWRYGSTHSSAALDTGQTSASRIRTIYIRDRSSRNSSNTTLGRPLSRSAHFASVGIQTQIPP